VNRSAVAAIADGPEDGAREGSEAREATVVAALDPADRADQGAIGGPIRVGHAPGDREVPEDRAQVGHGRRNPADHALRVRMARVEIDREDREVRNGTIVDRAVADQMRIVAAMSGRRSTRRRNRRT
jgi:hypothetical protein